MDFLMIDQAKCKQDGLCALDCPVGVIRFDGPGHYPALVSHGEEMCLRCGHCVAVCPHGAMDHAEVPLSECPPIDPSLALSAEQAEQFLRSRRSVRRFKDKVVAPAVLARLIGIARYAPTGSNSQSVRWLVINDRQRLKQIASGVIDWMRRLMENPDAVIMPYMPALIRAWDAGIDSVLRSAPCLVVAMAPATSRNGMVDLSLALAYLELAAPQFGLGTCWAGLLQGALKSEPELARRLGIPSGYPFHYPMMIGHSAVRYHRLPQRRQPEITWT